MSDVESVYAVLDDHFPTWWDGAQMLDITPPTLWDSPELTAFGNNVIYHTFSHNRIANSLSMIGGTLFPNHPTSTVPVVPKS